MSRKPIFIVVFILGAAVAAFLLLALGPQAHAQQGCLEFRAIGHGTLPSPHPLSPSILGARISGATLAASSSPATLAATMEPPLGTG